MDLEQINNKFGKILLTLVTISFLWIATFGLLSMGRMISDTTTNDCLFSAGQTKLCPMNTLDHITLWQNATTGLPQNIGSLIILILTTIILIAAVIFWQKPFYFSEIIFSRLRLYIKQHSRIHIHNFLQDFFSQGILNPKIYETVRL